MKRYFVLLGLVLCCSLAFADFNSTGYSGTATICDLSTSACSSQSFTAGPNSLSLFGGTLGVSFNGSLMNLTFNAASSPNSTLEITFGNISASPSETVYLNTPPSTFNPHLAGWVTILNNNTALDFTLTLDGNYQMGDTAQVAMAPEPSSLVLLSGVLPVAWFRLRSTRRQR